MDSMATFADALRRICQDQHGFLTPEDVQYLAEQDRLRQVLVRCGNCRFWCAAQDAEHLVAVMVKDGSDYVRDVSLPASDDAHQGVYRWHTTTEGSYQPTRRPSPSLKTRGPWPEHMFRESDCGGAFDGVNVISDADPGL